MHSKNKARRRLAGSTAHADSRSSIWPGPECLEPRSLVGRRVVLLSFRSPLTLLAGMRRDVGLVAVVLRETQLLVDVDVGGRHCWWWRSAAVVPEADLLRTHGIALGHVRVRARMERFVAWLLEEHACCAGLDIARRSPSPEAAVQLAALENFSHVRWLASKYAFGHDIWSLARDASDDQERDAAVSFLLASPEWASLPWQRATNPSWENVVRCATDGTREVWLSFVGDLHIYGGSDAPWRVVVAVLGLKPSMEVPRG